MSVAFETAIDDIWPDGPPAEEAGYLRSLPPGRRNKVARRLWAVLRAEEPDPDLGAIAATAGLSRTAFFELRRRWARSRSLRSLAPYEPREGTDEPSTSSPPSSAPASPLSKPTANAAPHRAASEGGRHAVERTAAVAALRANPAADNGDLARLVATKVGTALDHRTLVRLVRQERRLLHFSPRLLVGVYGRALLADVTALDLALDLDGVPEVAILALVVERSTTLILGHAVGARAGAVGLQALAADRAISFLAQERADVPREIEVGMKVVVGPGGGTAADRLAGAVVRRLGEHALVATGRLRYGVRTAALIGQPGRISLRPRITEPMAAEPDAAAQITREALPSAQADALLGAEIVRHNRSALEALRRVGLAGAGDSSGAMGELLADVFLRPAGG